jgi:hypothetical protein
MYSIEIDLSIINLFIIRLIKLKMGVAWRFAAPDLSLRSGHGKYVYLSVSGQAKKTTT